MSAGTRRNLRREEIERLREREGFVVMDVGGLPILPVDRFIDELNLPVASLTAPSTLSFVLDFI